MKRPHAIDDLRLRDDEVWVRCACGELVTGTDAETVNEPFQAHRVAAGERRRNFSSSEMVPPGGGITWRDANTVNPRSEANRRWREKNRAEYNARQREYRERRKAEVAA